MLPKNLQNRLIKPKEKWTLPMETTINGTNLSLRVRIIIFMVVSVIVVLLVAVMWCEAVCFRVNLVVEFLGV